jgi:uncharacterized protein (DUF58 family)
VSRATQLLAVGLALCLLAGAFAVSPLYIPGVAIVLVALAASSSVAAAAARTRVSVELDADSVEEGSPVAVTIRASGWPSSFAAAELRLGSHGAWTALEAARRPAGFALRPTGRGRRRIGPAFVRFRDPFSLSRRQIASHAPELLVLPRVERIPTAQLERVLELATPRGGGVAGFGVDGLRPYRPGAPATRIHWLTVARTGSLIERNLDEDVARARVMVVLDATAPRCAEELDMAVRAAASLAVSLAAAGGCAVLLPGERRAHTLTADMAGWPAMHTRLALVGAGIPPRWDAVSAELVVWVGPRHPPRAEIAGTARVGCAVSPVPAPDAPVLFTVARCAVQASLSAREASAA